MTITLIHIVHDHLSGRQDIDKTTEALLALSLPPARFEADVRATILYKLCEGDDEHLTGMQKLLHMILASAKAGICSREFCFQLLEEACDTQTIKGCDVLFRFLEKNRKSMTEGMGKGITLLRLCNELLRRLSKTEDTVFCGRILIFLSLAFPLAERSAVNLRGEYNVENVTSYEEDANMDENDANDEATTVHGVHVNDLYTNFWSLQSYFSNPPELLNNESTLQSFRNSLSTVLAALKTIEDSTRIHDLANDDKDTRKLAAKLANHEVQKYFTPKFLTSKKLLNLELADLSFRRHVLVQIMIAMDFLQLYSTEGREKWASENINKSMSSNYVLSSADLAWVLEIRKLATSILRAGRYGKTFLDTTEKILRQDRAWLLWKCNNCPAYDIPPVDQARLDNVPKKIALLTATKRAYPYPVGNAVLTNLWADAGGWSERELNDVKKYVISKLLLIIGYPVSKATLVELMN